MPGTSSDGKHPARRSADDDRVDGLLSRAAEGDQQAFAGVYDALAPPVMGLARRVLRDEAQAEEVTQDVMIEVWRTADRFRPERGAARSWVLTLAHRRAVDRVRSVAAGRAREMRSVVLEHEPPFDTVAETVEGREEQRVVFRCLGKLEDAQRVPLVLAFYQGLTYAEVADALAAPAGTIKSRMRQGLQSLRACLEAGS
ncbi:ECF RNA polymerase sigma factor SigK [Streptomyces pristinaespiralis]|jgi:RNA polymerase sigma-70 factor, ECF subfamily|uniref:RNA polymerase sigma factor SigK n=2 Tax=Streptomyces pristinaespiralis TaxID=38300 RepID=B5HJJ8_STRE2|nr:ECF RNA polymerase sigma factor SigK [Streptomyces pristinaespiralis]ALC23970.1 RNA polymerase sigma factor SigK [Streptomyces pristinaespiralis]EDY67009.2 RNA polymerase sigma factor SigK [Streptomyces pristinaespiralis ATCC 25486]QMU13622.1 ECF RNA polymerase sigma factor SigK [Streptomyces pristinaespiralis]